MYSCIFGVYNSSASEFSLCLCNRCVNVLVSFLDKKSIKIFIVFCCMVKSMVAVFDLWCILYFSYVELPCILRRLPACQTVNVHRHKLHDMTHCTGRTWATLREHPTFFSRFRLQNNHMKAIRTSLNNFSSTTKVIISANQYHLFCHLQCTKQTQNFCTFY